MLFRPPGIEFYAIDRIVFLAVLVILLLRALLLRKSLQVAGGLLWPMVGLTGLAIASALSHPFDATTWSVIVATFIGPFGLFWLSGLIFEDERSLHWLEKFSLMVLAYLTFVALAFLAGFHELIFPRFILDESIGIHADRARGPFLQAVANGVTLNFLGLLAIERYRQGWLHGIRAVILLACLPVAVLATKTRGVWLAFVVSVMLLIIRSADRKLWRICLVCAIVATIAVLLVAKFQDAEGALKDRFSDAGSIEFRMAVYQPGWNMFLEHPLTGWGMHETQAQLASRTSGFHGEAFAVHNTYLELLLEHGLVGFGLYVWLLVALFRLHREVPGEPLAVASIRRLWPLLLGVYLVNAMFVVMNYAFVNGLVFTYAGVLAANCLPSEKVKNAVVI
jgi:O-antigen ligase